MLLPEPLKGASGTMAPTVDVPPKSKEPLLLLSPAGMVNRAEC